MELERVQVRLPREEREALRHEAERLGLSMSEVVRRALRLALREEHQDEPAVDEIPEDHPFLRMVGTYASGLDDLGFNHDHYLYGGPKKQRYRDSSDESREGEAITAREGPSRELLDWLNPQQASE
jgi:Arc/MetJ-type ribon-helix-helix transcriptional regulator